MTTLQGLLLLLICFLFCVTLITVFILSDRRGTKRREKILRYRNNRAIDKHFSRILGELKDD